MLLMAFDSEYVSVSVRVYVLESAMVFVKQYGSAFEKVYDFRQQLHPST